MRKKSHTASHVKNKNNKLGILHQPAKGHYALYEPNEFVVNQGDGQSKIEVSLSLKPFEVSRRISR